MQILFLSHTAATGVFRVGSHHLSRELARRGHTVVHASTPVTPAHLVRLADPDLRRRARVALRGPRRDADGVLHVVARAPWPLASSVRAVREAGDAACAAALRRTLRRAGLTRFDAVCVDQPALEGVAIRLGAATLVYRATDTHDDDRFAPSVERLMEKVDGAIGTSAYVLGTLGPRVEQVPTLVLENGVEFERFAAGAAPPGDGAVYLGALDYRFDWDTVAHLARACPGLRFRMAGPADAPPADLPPNVELVGVMAPEDSSGFFRSARIGLLPLLPTTVNFGRSPMKYFEYLAAGLRVVARRTPTLEAQAAPGVVLYDTPEQAADGLRALLEHRARNVEGEQFARRFDWPQRAATLEAFLETL